MSSMREHIKKHKASAIILITFVGLFIYLLFYMRQCIREESWEEYNLETCGIISSFSSAGKGSKKAVLKQNNKVVDSIYFLGLGEKDDDILVRDSVFKKAKDVYFYIYRKNAGKDSLVYKKEIRGYYLGHE